MPTQKTHEPDAPPVIVVADEPERAQLQSACTAENLASVVVPSIAAAAQHAAAEPVGLLVVDIRGGDDASLGLLRELPSRSVYDAPLVVIVGADDAELVRRARAVGAEDFLVAPFVPGLVEQRLRFALDHAGRLRRLQAREAAAEAAAGAGPRDPLTGLPNRSVFRDRLELAVASARRSACGAGVMHVDIDGFRSINEGLGRDVGDQLLRQVAERLGRCLRASDTVARSDGPDGPTLARLGGDEFLLVLQDLADGVEPARIADRVVNALAQPYFIGETELLVSASVGIAMYPADGEAEQLVRRAETALGHARERGGNCAVFYSDRMNYDAAARLDLAKRLHRGLEQRQFELAFQPVFDAGERRVRSVEALLRWNDPDRGVIVPSDFVPVAEETGLILPLGDWVIEEACAQWRRWIEEGVGPVEISVNVSERQFRDADLVQRACASVERHGVDPAFLRFELTETALPGASSGAAGLIRDLQAVGIGFAIDDFGTGLTSLTALRRFPAEVLKIDRSFIKDLPESAEACSLVAAMVAMAHKLRMRVVAEGVETEAQLRFLKALDCEEVQGFLMARPTSGVLIQPLLRGQLDRRDLPVVLPFRRRTAS